MSDQYNIGSAIYARLDGQLSGSVYHVLAPQSSTPPYVIYQLQSGLDEYAFGTSSGVSFDYVIKAVSDRLWPRQALDLYGSAHTAINQYALTVTGYTGLRCERRSVIAPYQDPDGYWHAGGVYRVDVWKT